MGQKKTLKKSWRPAEGEDWFSELGHQEARQSRARQKSRWRGPIGKEERPCGNPPEALPL